MFVECIESSRQQRLSYDFIEATNYLHTIQELELAITTEMQSVDPVNSRNKPYHAKSKTCALH